MATPVTIFDRELYSEKDAAALLGLPTSTLRYWLRGETRGDTTYRPIIRPERVERRWVTWSEFIEAGWLATYRRRQGVPMGQLRSFIEGLRERTGVPYPLAHAQPLVSGRDLVLAAQQEADLDPEYQLVLHVDGQLLLSYTAELFMRRVVWDGDLATGWRPHTEQSLVTVKPDVRFGRPAVAGVSTISIFEQSEDGASNDELADDFGLTIAQVRWALSYENERHATVA